MFRFFEKNIHHKLGDSGHLPPLRLLWTSTPMIVSTTNWYHSKCLNLREKMPEIFVETSGNLKLGRSQLLKNCSQNGHVQCEENNKKKHEVRRSWITSIFFPTIFFWVFGFSPKKFRQVRCSQGSCASTASGKKSFLFGGFNFT